MPPGTNVQDSVSRLEWTRIQTDFKHQKYLELLMAVGLKEREEEQQLSERPQQRYFRFRPDRRTRQARMLDCHNNFGCWVPDALDAGFRLLL